MFDLIAERRIAEAIERGELDDALVPEDLRAAYRILKNAGFVPLEVQALNDIAQLESLIHSEREDARARSKALRKLALLRTRIEQQYHERAVGKLGR